MKGNVVELNELDCKILGGALAALLGLLYDKGVLTDEDFEASGLVPYLVDLAKRVGGLEEMLARSRFLKQVKPHDWHPAVEAQLFN